jgi:hypothetical protein
VVGIEEAEDERQQAFGGEGGFDSYAEVSMAFKSPTREGRRKARTGLCLRMGSLTALHLSRLSTDSPPPAMAGCKENMKKFTPSSVSNE